MLQQEGGTCSSSGAKTIGFQLAVITLFSGRFLYMADGPFAK
jgi:hypothetical protein